MPNFPLTKLHHKVNFKFQIAKMKWLLIFFKLPEFFLNEIKKNRQICIHGLHGEPKRKKALFVVFLSYFIYSQIWLNFPTYDHHFGYTTKLTPNNTYIHQCPLCTDDLIWTQEMPISHHILFSFEFYKKLQINWTDLFSVLQLGFSHFTSINPQFEALQLLEWHLNILLVVWKQGVCHTVALPFTLKKYLKAKEELWM
jgi:hypothetical protein